MCTRNICALVIGGETADAYIPAMEAMAAHLEAMPLRDVVTHRLPLEKSLQAVELSKTEDAMKVIVAPNE